jgi:hypothetical protein
MPASGAMKTNAAAQWQITAAMDYRMTREHQRRPNMKPTEPIADGR